MMNKAINTAQEMKFSIKDLSRKFTEEILNW